MGKTAEVNKEKKKLSLESSKLQKEIDKNKERDTNFSYSEILYKLLRVISDV